MIPSPSEIVRKRFWLAAVLRGVGIIFAVLAIAPLFSWFAEGLRDDDLLNFRYYYPRIVMVAYLGGGGLLVMFLSRPLARWVIGLPDPMPRCPRCNYTLYATGSMKCPECGLDLDPALLSPMPPPLPSSGSRSASDHGEIGSNTGRVTP